MLDDFMMSWACKISKVSSRVGKEANLEEENLDAPERQLEGYYHNTQPFLLICCVSTGLISIG